MKKIFTLIVSLGLLTAAFAQDGQYPRKSNGSAISQSYGSKNDRKGYSDGKGNKDYGSWSYQSNDRRGAEMKDRSDNRDDDRFDRRMHKERYNKDSRKSGLNVFFRFGGH